jgi:hypothetical protein
VPKEASPFSTTGEALTVFNASFDLRTQARRSGVESASKWPRMYEGRNLNLPNATELEILTYWAPPSCCADA